MPIDRADTRWADGARALAAPRADRPGEDTEGQLPASEAQVQAVLAAMTELVLVLDDRGRYLEIAPTNSKLLYRPSAELIGKTVHEIFPRSQADTFLACIKRALEMGQPVDLEYSLPIGGENIWFAATVSPMADG